MDRTSWLDTAVSGIRFGPDRKAVRAELEGHIEDKTADLQRIFPGIGDWSSDVCSSDLRS